MHVLTCFHWCPDQGKQKVRYGKAGSQDKEITARNIIIATGSVPFVPKGIEIDGKHFSVWVLFEFWKLNNLGKLWTYGACWRFIIKNLFISVLLNFNTHNEEDIDMAVNCSVIAIFNAPCDFRHCSAFQNFLVVHIDAVIPNSVLHAMLFCLSVCLIQLWLFFFSSVRKTQML